MRPIHEITKTLVLTTAHVTREAAGWLTEQATICDLASLVVYEKGDYGWWVNCVADDVLERNMPDCVRDCLRLARSCGCDWLMFDCDGSESPVLPLYRWDETEELNATE